ncbi:MAG TPA: hypothetical protein VE974_28420 [Thermoanaerobaculia bacterium]|nr:hypothetical protein [Thermoanaerobaculia bacterium]
MAVLKGAFIRLDNDLLGGLPVVVVFQFNPEKIGRTPSLQPLPMPEGSPTPTNAREVATQPMEAINFQLRLDCTDQLAAGNPLAVSSGILPTLSALELLMVPSSSFSIDLAALSGGKGSHQARANRLPLVLFFWGAFRILPVKVKTLTIDEQRFDTRLTPVRADVTVGLEVFTPEMLKGEKFAQGVYDYTKGVKEVMAALNLVNAAEIGVSASLSLSL